MEPPAYVMSRRLGIVDVRGSMDMWMMSEGTVLFWFKQKNYND